MSATNFLTVAEVAKILRVKPESVGELCRIGQIPATKPAGRWLIDGDDLTAFIAAASNQPAGDVA